MNRSLLLVICDFIILSLLALANFDTPGGEEEEVAEQRVEVENVQADQDLIEALQLSLEEERAAREELSGDLDMTQEALAEREEALAEREARLEALAADLEEREAEGRVLEDERARLEEQVAETEAEKERLAQARAEQEEEAQRSREAAQQMERDLRERQAELQETQEHLAQLEERQREAEEANRRLSTDLEVSESEKRLIRENLEEVRSEVEIVREEKSRIEERSRELAQGVSSLAEQSGEIAEEMRQSQPKTSATLFSEFQANQVRADFRAFRSRMFGHDIDRSRELRTILVTDGEQIYALFHTENTGITLRETAGWERLAGRLSTPEQQMPVQELQFLSTDPRIAVVEVPESIAEGLGTKVYQLAQEPFRFSEAVLIDSGGNYYGESSFTVNADHPQYVGMPTRIMSRLFGEFSPSTGDLVFSKTGELIGVMVNDGYCVLIDNFLPAAGLEFSRPLESENTLIRMQQRIQQLPSRLRM